MSVLFSRSVRAAAAVSVAFGLAGFAGASPASGAGAAQLDTVAVKAPPGREVPALATAKSITWKTDRGSYVTRIYERAVNVRDGKGGWQRIDNRLRPAAGGGFESGAGPMNLRVPASLGGAVKPEKDGESLSLKLRGPDVAAQVSGTTATFPGAGQGVTAKLTANDEAIKEDLILADAGAQTSFTYDLGLSDGLRPVERKDGGLDVLDAGGDVAFSAASPVAADSSGDVAPRAGTTMSVGKDGAGWTLSVSLDPAWVKAPGRAFPVTLDPSFSLGAARDCFISQGNPTNHYCSAGEMWVGRSGAGADNRGLTYFNVAGTVPAGAFVQEATLVLSPLYQSSPGAAKTLSAHRITSDWDTNAMWVARTSALNWATPGGDFDPTVLSTQPLPASGEKSNFTVTELFTDWLAGTKSNQGIAVTDNGSSVNNSQVYASADWSDLTKRPALEVEYYGRAGAKPNYTIDSQSISDRQSLGVNVAGGNLLLQATDLQVQGTGLPLAVQRAYNSSDPWDGQLGWGGRLSLGEDIALYECDATGARCLVGPGGYRVRFTKNPNGTFTTPPGIGNMTLKKLTTGSFGYELTDNGSGVTHEFFNASFSFMNAVRDKNGNKITLENTGAFGNLSKITDTHGRQYPVSLNGSGYVSKIEVPTSVIAGGQAWNYGYNAYNFLTSVTDPEGKVTSYEYAANNKINKVTDPRGNEIKIVYDSADRVSTVTRVVDGTTANDVTTTYVYSAPDGTW